MTSTPTDCTHKYAKCKLAQNVDVNSDLTMTLVRIILKRWKVWPRSQRVWSTDCDIIVLWIVIQPSYCLLMCFLVNLFVYFCTEKMFSVNNLSSVHRWWNRSDVSGSCLLRSRKFMAFHDRYAFHVKLNKICFGWMQCTVNADWSSQKIYTWNRILHRHIT